MPITNYIIVKNKRIQDMTKGLVKVAVATSSTLVHFQMLYTPNKALKKLETIEFKHVCIHSFVDEYKAMK